MAVRWSDTLQYIILKDGILRFYSCNITSKRGVYFTVHTPQGAYRLIVNEIYKEMFCLMIVKMIYSPYQDSTRDIRSNIPLHLQVLPRASPSGTPSGKGVYLIVYPSSRPNTDTIQSLIHIFNFPESHGVKVQHNGVRSETFCPIYTLMHTPGLVDSVPWESVPQVVGKY